MTALNHVRAFDYVRGIGAHMVVICHMLTPFLDQNQLSESWLAITLYSVTRYLLMCFFIISGFVIGHSLFSYVRKKERFDAYFFFVARAARIYPPLLTSLALEIVVYVLILSGMTIGYNSLYNYRLSFRDNIFLFYPLAVAGSAAGFNGPLGFNFMPLNIPLWTLGYELWFYWLAMLAFSFWFGSDREGVKSLIPMGLVLGLVVAIRNLNFLFLGTIWLYGFASYALIHRAGLSRYKVNVVLALGFFAFAAIAVMQIIREYDFAFPDETYKGFLAQLVICAALACLLAKASLQPDRELVHSIISSAISRMSSHSYTLYVLHMPMLVFADYALGDFLQELNTWSLVAVLTAIYVGIALTADRASRVLEDSKRYKMAVAKALKQIGIEAR